MPAPWIRSVRCSLAFALAAWLCPRSACAQQLVVVEGSEQDRAAADKLAELVSEPFARAAAGADPCAVGARFALFLDSAQNDVRLVRCGDGTELARAIDPEAARRTPYLAAFVAAELWGLNAELERAAAPAVEGPAATNTSPLPAASAAAPPAPSTAEVAAEVPRRAQLRLALGAELIASGAPFSGALRPVLIVGVNGPAAPHSLTWLFELAVAPFAAGEITKDDERIDLDRHDVRLGGGVVYTDGALSLAGTLFGRASLTEMAYVAGTPTTQLRWGVGAALRIELGLASWLAVWAGALADVAATGSSYEVDGMSWAEDSVLLVAASGGLLVRVPL